MVDRAAKSAASNVEDTIQLDVHLDLHEYCLHIDKIAKESFVNRLKTSESNYSNYCIKTLSTIQSSIILKNLSTTRSRQIMSLMFKLRLNAFRTKFTKDIKCLCGNQITIKHFLLHCPIVNGQITKSFGNFLHAHIPLTTEKILNDFILLNFFSEILHSSPIGIFL